MQLKNKLKSLEKRHIISRKPHPIIPFILGLIIIILIIYTNNQLTNKTLNLFLYLLAIITFVFAIIHLIVVIFLKKK
tara:strand:+ start:1075 stop:1305 length:231 start_codon:yes stop_codon:yes gene_type:complete